METAEPEAVITWRLPAVRLSCSISNVAISVLDVHPWGSHGTSPPERRAINHQRLSFSSERLQCDEHTTYLELPHPKERPRLPAALLSPSHFHRKEMIEAAPGRVVAGICFWTPDEKVELLRRWVHRSPG